MPGLIGGGGSSNQVQYVPYNAGGTGQGGTVYTPSAQPQADTTYQALLNNLYGQYTGGTTPPQQNYPLAENAALNIAQNPYAQPQLTGAATISPLLENLGLNSINLGTGYENLLPQITGLGDTLASSVPQVTGLANTLESYMPGVANLANTVGGYSPQAAALSGQVAGYMQPTAALAGQVAGYMPQVSALSPQVTAGIAPLQQGAANLLQTGYDPQSALYQQLRQQSLQQSAGANAMAGLGSSPYGAGLTADALNNMNINWQNQQLQRQAQALQGAGQAYGQAGQLGTEGANILGLAGNLGGLSADIYGRAGQLGTAAGNLLGTAGQLGSEASNIWGRAGQLGGEAGGLYGQAGQLGTGAANIYESVPGFASGLLNLGTGGANAFMGGAGLPYQTSVGQSQAALPALTSATNLGISQYQLPQQVINDLQSYLRLGQSASDLSGVLGNLGYNQGQQTLGNIGGALGMADPLLFGSQGLTGALGLNPQTGLFGGGSGGVLGGLFGAGAGGTITDPLAGAALADTFSAGAAGFSPLDLGLLFA